MRSTSLHNLNADRNLNWPLRRLWFLANWANNHLLPNSVIHEVNIRDFIANVSDLNWRQTHPMSSPSRKLSDLFWIQLPWAAIQAELGEIHALDIGCGSGNHGVRLLRLCSGRLRSYTGIDVRLHQQWTEHERNHPGFKFYRANCLDLGSVASDHTNLLTSQSALEHFEDDMRLFQQIRRLAAHARSAIIQIHLIPSSACLRLYGLHGVRQYTARTASYITWLFRAFSYCRLYRLGAEHCNRLHWQAITKPTLGEGIGDYRSQGTRAYDECVRAAILADNEGSRLDPSFYALVIHSNCRRTIFD
jgi:SAM-dependent methyltransferase